MAKKTEAQEQHSIIGYAGSDRRFVRNAHPDAQWFYQPTKLGLFIHFGIASVGGDIDLSWGMMENPQRRQKGNGIVTPREYWNYAKVFDPTDFHPKKWLSAVKAAGFDYAVFTTRHHDGYAMWPSNVGDFSTKQYMNGRDIVGEYVTACRAVGLKVGLYYSPPDWRYNQKYMSFMVSSRSASFPDRPHMDTDHNAVDEIPPMPREHLEKYAAYVNAQVRELLTRYGKIDLFWFDGTIPDVSLAIDENEMRALQPSMVINDRLWGVGDFNTKYECSLPAEKPPFDVWEASYGWHVGGGWGYVINADKFRPLDVLTERYSVVKRFGGNLILNIAPDKTGKVPDAFYDSAAEFGEWLKSNC